MSEYFKPSTQYHSDPSSTKTRAEIVMYQDCIIIKPEANLKEVYQQLELMFHNTYTKEIEMDAKERKGRLIELNSIIHTMIPRDISFLNRRIVELKKEEKEAIEEYAKLSKESKSKEQDGQK